jgi:hypothetical protein
MVKNNKNIRFFNMIEVALAMAIIAFGMTSILGLFPVGLNACRNSVAENCASDSVAQFSSFLKGHAEANWTNFEAMFGQDAVTGYYREAKPTGAPIAVVNNFLSAIASGKDTVGNPYPTPAVASGWSIFYSDNISPYTTYRGTYFTVMGPGNYLSSPAVKFPSWDFAGMIMVWKSPLKSYVPNPAGTGWVLDEDVNYERGAGLNVEISWPLDVQDYNARQKRTFYIEVVRPQQ